MNLRSGKVRLALAAPVAAVVALTLAGCQTHAGAAATVGSSTISESSLGSYITPTLKPITYSSGETVAPRIFVLQALIQEKLLTKLFAETGAALTQADFDGAKSDALGGGAESDFTAQVTGLGLPAKLEPILLRTQEMAVLLQKRFMTQAKQEAVIEKYGKQVTVSPRYGSWNPTNLSLSAFGTKQISDAVTYTTPLPGDTASATAAP